MKGLGMQGPERRRAVAFVASLCASVVVLMGAASTASAGPVFGVGVSVPPTVVVGSTGNLATLRIQNISFSDSGEAGFEDDSYVLDDITYIPSCGSQLPVADCPIGAKDPGVLVPSPLVATGRAGTACETRTFAITQEGPPADGKYRFTPDATITLAAATGALATRQCVIDFRISAVKSPTVDSDTTEAGLQTDPKGSATGHDVGPTGANLGEAAAGTGTTETRVAP